MAVNTNLVEDEELRNRTAVFKDRQDAGVRLAGMIYGRVSSEAIILAIPSGGVPVAKVISAALHLEMDLLVVRKLKIPGNTEAGFGATNLDGDLVLNTHLVRSLGLGNDEIKAELERTSATLKHRESLFRGGKPFPDLTGRTIVLVDDGLASGFTMRAAIRYAARRAPAGVIVAVPTGSYDAVARISKEVEMVICPNIREYYPFAVASAYTRWHDLSDSEVIALVM